MRNNNDNKTHLGKCVSESRTSHTGAHNDDVGTRAETIERSIFTNMHLPCIFNAIVIAATEKRHKKKKKKRKKEGGWNSNNNNNNNNNNKDDDDYQQKTRRLRQRHRLPGLCLRMVCASDASDGDCCGWWMWHELVTKEEGLFTER